MTTEKKERRSLSIRPSLWGKFVAKCESLDVTPSWQICQLIKKFLNG